MPGISSNNFFALDKLSPDLILQTGLKFAIKGEHHLNSFLANAPILYPLKTPENQRFFCVFRGYKMGTLARDGFREELAVRNRLLINFVEYLLF